MEVPSASVSSTVKNALGDHAGALCAGKHRSHLRLHIGREAGMRLGLYAGADILAAAYYAHSVVVLLDLNAYLDELVGYRLEVLRDNVLYQQLAACCRRDSHKRARLYLVGDNAVCRAVEVLHAAYFYNVGACAENVRAHRVKAVGKVDDVRLLCGVFDYCKTVSLYRRHNSVYGSADGVFVKEYLAARELIGAEIYHTAVDVIGRAERGKALEVLVYGPVAEVAAAGHGNVRLVETPEQRPEEICGSSHELCLFIRNRQVFQRTRVYLDGRFVEHTDICAHFGHYL